MSNLVRWNAVPWLALVAAACGSVEVDAPGVGVSRAALVGSKEDREAIATLAVGGRELLALLDRGLMAGASPTNTGNVNVTVTGADGARATYVTEGADRFVRLAAEDLRAVSARSNRETVARQLSSLLVEEGVTPRDRRDPARIDDAALVSLTEALAEQLLALPAPQLEPAQSGPVACSQEQGTPAMITDGPGTCAQGASVRQFGWYPLEAAPSCLRNQGNRGSCSAFAVTAGVELSRWVRQHEQVNLSEQHLYAKAKLDWQPSLFEDGLGLTALTAKIYTTGYRFPLESAWTYNPSYARVEPGFGFASSCVGYGGLHCSETAGQADMHATPGLPTFWDASVPAATSIGLSVPFGVKPDVVGMKVARALLWRRVPLALGTALTTSFFTTGADGRVPLVPAQLDAYGGSHAMLVVGWVDSLTLPVPLRSPDSGYFVVKNSWGCGFGDGGYVYLPATYLAANGVTLQAIRAN